MDTLVSGEFIVAHHIIPFTIRLFKVPSVNTTVTVKIRFIPSYSIRPSTQTRLVTDTLTSDHAIIK